MKIIFLAMMFLMLIHHGSFSQSIDRFVIGSTGNFSENTSLSLSSTTGETVVETFVKTSNTLTQGFQQPDDFSTVIEEVLSPTLSVSLFPNPAVDQVILDISTTDIINFSIELTDILGRSVETYISLHHENDQTRFVIDMQSLPSAIYILHLSSEKTSVDRSFKVLKLNF